MFQKNFVVIISGINTTLANFYARVLFIWGPGFLFANSYLAVPWAKSTIGPKTNSLFIGDSLDIIDDCSTKLTIDQRTIVEILTTTYGFNEGKVSKGIKANGR